MTAFSLRPAIACLIFGIALLLDAPQAAPAAGGSGLPIPRFVSLASSEVNMRAGPGRRYPIRWVYVRKGLPMKVEAEFDIWRKVRDSEGETGWIHGSLLSGRRTVEIRGKPRALHHKPHPASTLVLKAEPGVIAELLKCEGRWCRLGIAGKKGWMEKDGFWGVLDGE